MEILTTAVIVLIAFYGYNAITAWNYRKTIEADIYFLKDAYQNLQDVSVESIKSARNRIDNLENEIKFLRKSDQKIFEDVVRKNKYLKSRIENLETENETK